MRIVVFCHSILSDWNHGNAHFLRGVVTELVALGHDVRVFEARDAWSVANLVRDHGEGALARGLARHPHVTAVRYDLATLDLDRALDGADLVIVHEWSPHELVRRIGDHRTKSRHTLLFHDTHHRAVTDPQAMRAYALDDYDGVLAFGATLRDIYAARGWGRRAFTWHEGADVRVFRPCPDVARVDDVVWIGNWGDDERTRELDEMLFQPAAALGLSGTVYGVRYPALARARVRAAGLAYGGWLPNSRAPEVFAAHRATVHVPRRPYVRALRGIPTIRPFEALACGIPLVCAEWDDVEGLFAPGRDYLVARSGDEMRAHLARLRADPAMGDEIARHGRNTVLARHTCAHRAKELLAIHATIGARQARAS